MSHNVGGLARAGFEGRENAPLAPNRVLAAVASLCFPNSKVRWFSNRVRFSVRKVPVVKRAELQESDIERAELNGRVFCSECSDVKRAEQQGRCRPVRVAGSDFLFTESG